jgi:multicomponent Na+:H+ antiporter subunit D
LTTLLILLPLVSIVILNLPVGFTRRGARGAAMFFALLDISIPFMAGGGGFRRLAGRLDGFFQFDMKPDGLGFLMLLSVGIAALCAILLTRSSIRDEKRAFYLYNLYILVIAGMNGVVISSDLFSMYIFIEVAAVSSFIMIAQDGEKDSLEGSFKYIIQSAVATALMLTSIALLLLLTGDTSFSGVEKLLHGQSRGGQATLAVMLFTCALFIKGGIVPFHGWLPDAYSAAPAPVSVLLAGIITKTTGIYTLIRLSHQVFGVSGSLQTVLLLFGLVSVVVGALAAMAQKDFKRMLAYSSISQVGYIVLGLASGSALGLAGAVFHLFNHALFKTQLFVISAALEQQAGTRDMDRMGGFSARMPLTAFTSLAGSLSTAGMPPFSGFWSKMIIILALWRSGHPLVAAAAIAASVITLAYFLVMQRKVFWGSLPVEYDNLKEAGAALIVPAAILALLTIALGLLFPFITGTFLFPARGIF